jgi:hypothetical protein
MAEEKGLEEKVASSSEQPLIHQTADAQQEESCNLDSSANAESERQESSNVPCAALQPIEFAAPLEKTFRELQARYKKLEEISPRRTEI